MSEQKTVTLEVRPYEAVLTFLDHTINSEEIKMPDDVISKAKELEGKILALSSSINSKFTKTYEKPIDKTSFEFALTLSISNFENYLILHVLKIASKEESTDKFIDEIKNILLNLDKFIELTHEFFNNIVDDCIKLGRIYDDKKCVKCDEYLEAEKIIVDKFISKIPEIKEFIDSIIPDDYKVKDGEDDNLSEMLKTTLIYNFETIKSEILESEKDESRDYPLLIDLSEANEETTDDLLDLGIDNNMMSVLSEIIPSEEELEFYKEHPIIGRDKLKRKLKKVSGNNAIPEDIVDQMWMMIMQLSRITNEEDLEKIIGHDIDKLIEETEEMDSIEEDTDKVE